jgi:hypothetical protein
VFTAPQSKRKTLAFFVFTRIGLKKFVKSVAHLLTGKPETSATDFTDSHGFSKISENP